MIISRWCSRGRCWRVVAVHGQSTLQTGREILVDVVLADETMWM